MRYNIEQMKAVARVHAQANKSDPFAYGRILNLMKRGLEEPEEVLKEAMNIIKSRGEKWSM